MRRDGEDHVALELPIDGGKGDQPIPPIETVIAEMRRQLIISVRLDLDGRTRR